MLGKAVAGQMLADVPLGAFLSGRYRLLAVVALMQAQSSRPVRTFTIGFSEKDYDEATHARPVAAHLGTEHTELRLTGEDALELVSRNAGDVRRAVRRLVAAADPSGHEAGARST